MLCDGVRSRMDGGRLTQMDVRDRGRLLVGLRLFFFNVQDVSRGSGCLYSWS